MLIFGESQLDHYKLIVLISFKKEIPAVHQRPIIVSNMNLFMEFEECANTILFTSDESNQVGIILFQKQLAALERRTSSCATNFVLSFRFFFCRLL